jgi:quercetin dioxygenase-like cupin family protein
MSEAEGHAYLREHQLKGETMLFDWDEEARSVLDEANEAGARRSARTLVKDGPLRLTLVGIKAGASLRDHKAGGPVNIHVLEGDIDVKVGERTERLQKGRSVVLASDVAHSLQAQSDSVLLLTIAMPS